MESLLGKRQREEEEPEAYDIIKQILDDPTRYGMFLLDPPWEYRDGRITSYKTRGESFIADVMKAIVKQVGGRPVLIGIWCTSPCIDILFRSMEPVLKSTDIRYVTKLLCWLKTDASGGIILGQGHYTRSAVEDLYLFGNARAASLVTDFHQSQVIHTTAPDPRCTQILKAPRTEHSKKPEIYRSVMDKFTHPLLPKCELFARCEYSHWTCLGDQVGKFPREDGMTESQIAAMKYMSTLFMKLVDEGIDKKEISGDKKRTADKIRFYLEVERQVVFDAIENGFAEDDVTLFLAMKGMHDNPVKLSKHVPR